RSIRRLRHPRTVWSKFAARSKLTKRSAVSQTQQAQRCDTQSHREAHGGNRVMMDVDIEAAVAEFEAKERVRLNIISDDVPKQHWHDPVPSTFTRDQRDHTTILVSGLTMAQDLFVQHGLRGVGYKVQHMDCPDNEALRYGKEFGNRGQCNPTYFTV